MQVFIPRLFLYIPVQELGSKSRTDSNSDGDSGTYTAKGEINSHALVYMDINMGEALGSTVYGKLGFSRATIVTKESLNSGSTFKDQDVYGFTVGLGGRGEISGPYFYKVEGTYTNYEEYSDVSSANNKVAFDTEIYSAKFSVGMAF